MKTFTKLSFLLFTFLSFFEAFADRPVQITIDWDEQSWENKVELYDQANNLLLTICNTNIPDPNNPVSQCYNNTGTEEIFTGTYDLGCIQSGNYYIRLFNINNTPWSNSDVSVVVDGVEVINDDGDNASDTGFDINFSVANGGASCSPANVEDTDGDGVIDRIDLDDDNDGIPDADEGLGINSFDCTVPALNFAGNNNTPESGTAGSVGAIYRFENAIFGEPYDVLVEITEVRNATLINIDDDGVDNENYLQTRLSFTGNETPADCVGCDYPGITFQFTIVDAGTSTPAATLFRIGGTTWDVDGPSDRRESVRYYSPSAYGTDNPTTLNVTDVNGDDSVIEMTAGGVLEGPGFSTIPQLRSYFQFLSNTFTLRMQNVRTTFTATNNREYGMSFTQCDVLDFQAASITIVNGQNDDGDAYDNQVDIDADNDGIPDNVEAQSTIGYIAPSGNIDPLSGIDASYVVGFTYVDTDGDQIYDFLDTDSDGDGTPDIQENGMADNIVSPNDPDRDGLDTIFETNGNETGMQPFDVNEDIENPSDLTILPDSDGDLALGGDLDYRDAIDVFFSSASVDFDGVDDYLTTPGFLDGQQEVTLMAWVKINPAFAGGQTLTIMGQRIYCKLTIGPFNNPFFTVRTDTSPTIAVGAQSISNDEWHHITGTFSGITGESRIYVDGELELISPTDFTGQVIGNSGTDFEIGRDVSDDDYFYGSIDEVRVFNTALTENQIQRMVYQEIENNGSFIKGTVIDKNIVDISTNATLPWSSLLAYYPMTDILSSKTTDYSVNARDADIKNVRTIQSQTAPMPFESVADGLWSEESTWLHGNVWNITGSATSRAVSTIKNWAIVRVRSNVSVPFSVKSLGMLIDSGSSLTVTGDNFIENTWYFALNGTLDLQDDSQLVQGVNSDLVTSAAGKILRRQEGNTNVFWYNYWSSPVGSLGATTLTNNNGTSDNTNNTAFNLSMLKDGSGVPFTFTTSLAENGMISEQWLYSYQNGQTFWDWTALTPSSAIAPGIGYTQKGTGNTGTTQQYIFEGKPNNGTILIAADDVDGDTATESDDGSRTTLLVGNPYPSALDAEEFIRDNIDFDNGGANPIIQGTILLWEQWAGNSHWLSEYEGGYGYINLTTTARAYQHPDIPIADQTQTQGIKTPTKFIPVGQGFFVEVINDGDIEFNNSQRVFKNENAGESVFFRVNQTEDSATEANPMQTIKLEFGVSNGATRRFVLGFSDTTTDAFDYGYDGGLITDVPEEDMTSSLGDKLFVIQAFSPITEDKVIDLAFTGTGNHTYSLGIVDIKNIDETQDVYLRDHLADTYFNLRNGQPYMFTSEAGQFNDRFDIVFKTDETLSNNLFENNNVVIYINNIEDKLFIKGLEQDAKSITLVNMLGQNIKTMTDVSNNTMENGISIENLSSGVYIVDIKTEDNKQLSKKIILE